MKLVDYLNSQLQGATSIHSEALGAVTEYRDYYDGYVDLPSVQGHSNVVVRDVQRTIEGALPSLVDPFLSKDICVVESQNAESEQAAKANEELINYQWNKKGNPLETVEVLARNLMVDGTCWVKSGWSPEGYATVENVPFEQVIPDPSAYTVDDCKFMIHRRKVTVSDILGNPNWFGKQSLESLQPLMPSNDSEYEPGYDVGRDDSYDSGQRAMDELEVFEYYGLYDRSGKGVTEPIVAIWCENTLLNEFDSPYPEFWNPFDNAVYTRRPFSIYGIGVGGVIGDMQTQRSGLMRGIFDNMSRSNNAIKFIKKGALDGTNYNRLRNKEPIVEINHNHKEPLGNAMWDGNFNALPPDIYKMLADIETDEENLTGITKYAVGNDSRALNQTATGISIITSMSQRRLLFIAQHISGLLGRVFKKWMLMNKELLDDPSLYGEFDLVVVAGTAGVQQKRAQDINSMLTALASFQGQIDPKIVTNLIAELAESFDLNSTAKYIKQSNKEAEQMQGQPNPEKEAIKQIQFEKELAGIQKDKSIAAKNFAQAQENQIDAAIKSTGG